MDRFTPLNLRLPSVLQSDQPKTALEVARESILISPITQETLLLTNKTLPYEIGADYRKTDNHHGQRKLLCNELLVLGLYGFLDRSVTVVYAGAAPGHHLAASVKIFPRVKWHLYDTRELAVSDPRITFHQHLFTDDDAAYWATQSDVIFFSDIRSVGKNTEAKYTIERAVANDMAMQQRWVETMRPLIACLKFRLPYVTGYGENVFIPYLPGDLYTQPWASAASTEGRLVVQPKDYGKRMIYDAASIEDRFCYHNNVIRPMTVYDNRAYDFLLSLVGDVASLRKLITAAGI